MCSQPRERRLIMFLIISSIIFKTHTLSINCKFEDPYFRYTCLGIIINEDVAEKATQLFGIHQNGNNDSDVVKLYLRKRNLKFFIKNTERFFPNLLHIDMSENLITSMTNAHLNPHQKLEYLHLRNNRITVLENNLFDGLPNLRYIDLDHNDITHVSYDVKLPANCFLFILKNECINEVFIANETIDLSSVLRDQCPPVTPTTEPQERVIQTKMKQNAELQVNKFETSFD